MKPIKEKRMDGMEDFMNFQSPNKVQIPIEIIIELGLIRKRDVCAKCGKKMDVKDYHIQLCMACREVELEKYYKGTLERGKHIIKWW